MKMWLTQKASEVQEEEKRFHLLLGLLTLFVSSLSIPQMFSSLLSSLALETADEDGIDQIQYSSSNSWNNL